MRAEIHTGDEFEELATAFNRMLRHLITIQEELRQVNVNLDGKVDELAQVNMRLYEMNRLKSDFLATMSHELRTPLNSILGFSDVLGSIDSLDDKQKRYVQNIQKSGKMLLEMINDILDLAKIESGKMEVRLTDFRIDRVIAAQCDMARPLTERKNIDLETEIDPELAAAAPGPGQRAADPQQPALQRHQVHARGRADRRSRAGRGERDESACCTVTDTGVGIAEEDQAGDFREIPPGQDGAARRRRHDPRILRHAGWGCRSSRNCASCWAARSRSQSELGKGSTFTVRLPWTRADSSCALKLEAVVVRVHIAPRRSPVRPRYRFRSSKTSLSRKSRYVPLALQHKT